MMMSMFTRLLGIAAVLFALGASEAYPAETVWKGAWKFDTSHQDQPWLGFYEPKGKTVFLIGCGTHFEVLAVYPATPKQDGRQPATVTIASGSKQMDFAGFVDEGSELTPPRVRMFDQADLGQPDLEEKPFREMEYRVLDLFSSGQKLTISAEGKSYVLPPVKAPRWRERWEKIC